MLLFQTYRYALIFLVCVTCNQMLKMLNVKLTPIMKSVQ